MPSPLYQQYVLRLYQFVHEMGVGCHCFLTRVGKLVPPCHNHIPGIQPPLESDPASSALESNVYVSLCNEDGPEMHAGVEHLSYAIKMFERN